MKNTEKDNAVNQSNIKKSWNKPKLIILNINKTAYFQDFGNDYSGFGS